MEETSDPFLDRTYCIMDLIDFRQRLTRSADKTMIDWLIQNTARTIAVPLQQARVHVIDGGLG